MSVPTTALSAAGATTQECRDLLFEVGMAEVPARFLPGMAEQLAARLGKGLTELGLEHAGLEAYGAPRRVAVIVRSLPLRQPDRTQEVRGPSAKAAYGADGAPTKAAAGFARAQGVAVADLIVREGAGAEYVYAVRLEPGRQTEDLLVELLPKILLGMQFPRNMRWGTYEVTFVRPIRWLLCLLGERPLRVQIPGLPSDLADPLGSSRGHRFLAPGPVPVATPAAYLSSLRAAAVLADPAERRALIVRGAAALAAEAGGRLDLHDDLLEELSWLSEHPTPVLGGFDAANLVLPEPILVTVMQHHQRFAPVRRPDGGGLLPLFVGVRDGGLEHTATVRAGYETVLRARLADARFFFAEDRKRRLAERIADLHDLVYQEKLGSMAAKTKRLARIAEVVASMLGFGEGVRLAAVRAAGLAKCDLVTQVVRELPELQGTMGAEYARLDGEDEVVATAIAEQYLPVGEGTRPPATAAGLALAVADKLDALVGHFWAGVRPTGSQDPYGMRRAAQGIVAGVLAQGLDLDLAAAVDAAAAVFASDGFAEPALTDAVAEVKALLRSRLEAALGDLGVAFDEIDCLLASTGLTDRTSSLAAAGAALHATRGSEWFRPVCAAAVRSSGLGATAAQALELAPGEPVPPADPGLFNTQLEHELLQALCAAQAAADTHFAAGAYASYWQALGSLGDPVNRFFDGVLVMDKDERVRRNRLALCSALHRTFARAGDLSRLVWPGEQQA